MDLNIFTNFTADVYFKATAVNNMMFIIWDPRMFPHSFKGHLKDIHPDRNVEVSWIHPAETMNLMNEYADSPGSDCSASQTLSSSTFIVY